MGKIKFLSYETVVIGSGAAGFNALNRLFDFGVTDIALVTEGVKNGTSRNTGSDKQTYYKLTLSGNEGDSVGEMAQTLFEGQCVDGDIALVEAALSVRCFMHLTELGVPFPTDRYGQFVGYKTDHDPRERATSTGPLTSKLMTEALEESVKRKRIPILDQQMVIRILTENNQVRGLLCINRAEKEDPVFTLISCNYVIMATGGPAGIYKKSVYPLGHYGSSGLAYQCGAYGKNLTEWQFGIVSVKPRWNISGTFMQCLPRFISTNEDGSEPVDFLHNFFEDHANMLNQIFKKGYQWPFDVRKVNYEESSVIDLLVYTEIELKKRRVFLDFSNNPGGVGSTVDFNALSNETYEYLSNIGALLNTPIERLRKMNMPAYEFYLKRGVNLEGDLLEVDICAQHNNGGIDVNSWWESSVKGLFVCGEAACTHGVYRPGGAALNSGQVGSTRAAQYISIQKDMIPWNESTIKHYFKDVLKETMEIEKMITYDYENVTTWIDYFTEQMSTYAGPIRNEEKMEELLKSIEAFLQLFLDKVRVNSINHMWKIYRLHDILRCQMVYLNAYIDYCRSKGMSRGSALYYKENGKLLDGLDENFRFYLDDESYKNQVQLITQTNTKCEIKWRNVRPIPQNDLFFENIWQQFRNNKNIY